MNMHKKYLKPITEIILAQSIGTLCIGSYPGNSGVYDQQPGGSTGRD